MTTLQEAVKKFIEATKLDRIEFEDWPRDSQTAFETLRAALAQQGGDIHRAVDKAVAGVTQRLRVKTVTMKCGDTNVVLPVIDSYDGHVLVAYTAAPAPQPAQGVPEVGFGDMPYSPYLFGGLRFKMNFDKSGNATNFHGVESSLQGAWVALVDATDNRHLQSAQPVAPPLTLEQILDIVKKLDETPDMSHVDVLKTFARAIEAAHGIREVK